MLYSSTLQVSEMLSLANQLMQPWKRPTWNLVQPRRVGLRTRLRVWSMPVAWFHVNLTVAGDSPVEPHSSSSESTGTGARGNSQPLLGQDEANAKGEV